MVVLSNGSILKNDQKAMRESHISILDYKQKWLNLFKRSLIIRLFIQSAQVSQLFGDLDLHASVDRMVVAVAF